MKILMIVNSLQTPVGVWPWSIINNPMFLKAMYSVTEEQIKVALRLVIERMKLVAEPSAVVLLAVCLFDKDFRHMIERGVAMVGGILVLFSVEVTGMKAIAEMFAKKPEDP